MIKFAYDTLGTSKELKAAGMERNQAEAVAIAIAQREGNLATKSDNNEVKSELSAFGSKVKFELSALRTEVKFELSEMKSDMKSQFRWMMSMQIVTFLAILALVVANGL